MRAFALLQRPPEMDDSEEAIGQWVEERITEFIDTYLRLETHPLYQKDNIVIDPICGMPDFGNCGDKQNRVARPHDLLLLGNCARRIF